MSISGLAFEVVNAFGTNLCNSIVLFPLVSSNLIKTQNYAMIFWKREVCFYQDFRYTNRLKLDIFCEPNHFRLAECVVITSPQRSGS